MLKEIEKEVQFKKMTQVNSCQPSKTSTHVMRPR
jgi:hypothetical protein